MGKLKYHLLFCICRGIPHSSVMLTLYKFKLKKGHLRNQLIPFLCLKDAAIVENGVTTEYNLHGHYELLI